MSGMKVLSLVEFSKHCAFHQCSAQNAALMLLSSSSAVPYHPNSDLTQNAYMGAQWWHLMHKILTWCHVPSIRPSQQNILFLISLFSVPLADAILAEPSPESLRLEISCLCKARHAENVNSIYNTAFANCAN